MVVVGLVERDFKTLEDFSFSTFLSSLRSRDGDPTTFLVRLGELGLSSGSELSRGDGGNLVESSRSFFGDPRGDPIG